MREIDIEHIKRIELEILNEFHGFCEKHGLTYYLAFGTLLGAVRHKGFIPWDDDVDVLMPRSDFERFMNLYSGSNRYGLIYYPKNKNSWLSWGKMYDQRTSVIEKDTIGVNNCGVYIDIFPLDYLSDTYDDSLKIYKINKKRFTLIYSKIFPVKIKNLKSFLLFMARPFISWRFYLGKIRKEGIKRQKRREYSCITAPVYGEKMIVESVFFDKKVKMKFENNEYWVPSGYDAFLKRIYGNYLSLPPLEEQVPHHNLLAYWKNDCEANDAL